MEDKYIVAIEIGSSKIRGALASIDTNGIVDIHAVKEVRLVDSVRYGQVKNIDEVSSKIEEIMRSLEMSKIITPRRIKGVYVGLSGSSVGASNITTTMDLDANNEITAATVGQLMEKATKAHFTEKDIYEVLPTQYMVDNETTMQPAGRIGKILKGDFKVIEGVPGIKSNLNRVFTRLNLEVEAYIVSAIAQADTVLSAEEKQLGCMFVDFGAETTTVAIYKGGVLRSLSTLPMGSRNINRDLMSLNHLEEQAESIKRSMGVNVAPEGSGHFTNQHAIDQPEIGNYIQARTGEIIANVLAQIEYAGLKPSELPSGIIIAGGGARMKGFSDMLSEQSKMKVRMGTAPRNIRIFDASVLADDAIDVISLVLNAARNNPVQCVTEPEQKPIEPTRRVSEPGYDDYDSEEVRIGHMDDDEDLEGVEFIDNPKPRKHKEAQQKPTKPSREPKVREPKQPSRSAEIFNSLKDRLAKLMSDTEDDEFDSDQE